MRQPKRGGPPPAVVISGLALLATVLWLAVPDVALANNCPSRALAEYGTCLKQNFGAGLALLGGALLAAGAAIWSAAGGSSTPDDEDADEHYTPPPLGPPDEWLTGGEQNPAYNPDGFNTKTGGGNPVR